MSSKYRRTLSLEDLVNGSDDEMDELLCQGASSKVGTNSGNKIYNNSTSPYTPPVENGTRVGPIIAPNDSPEYDFFLHGPQAPILNLDNTSTTLEIDVNQKSASSTINLPRSKSVRFQEPERKVRDQLDEVTGRMKDNVARLLDREANLGSLQDLSDQVCTHWIVWKKNI